MAETTESFEVRRGDLRTVRLVTEPLPAPGSGQVLVRVDRFGLTANNITCGVAGDLSGYWGSFPTSDGRGRIPARGFADVVAG